MKTKVSFEVTYNPSEIVQIGKFMSEIDLGIEGLELPTKIIFSYNTTTKVDDKYIEKMIGILELAVKDNCGEVIKIERIK